METLNKVLKKFQASKQFSKVFSWEESRQAQVVNKKPSF